jgi:quercetin dioxygenase-like cupin family protein
MTDGARAIREGQLVYLLGGTEHSIRGVRDSTVLLTIVLEPA